MLRAVIQRNAPRATNGVIRQMSKEIKFGVEGRAAMLRGVDLLANTVQVRQQERMGYVYDKPTRRIS